MQNINLYNERSILVQLANGDRNAFRIIFDTYAESIYANCFYFTRSAEEAKDLRQEIFARVWENREKFSSVNELGSYLFVLSKNMVRNQMRKKVLNISPHEDGTSNLADGSVSAMADVELKDLRVHIEAAVIQLPPQLQKAFRLSRYHGMTHDEIANQMGISIYTSKTYITRALEMIRNYLVKNTGIRVKSNHNRFSYLFFPSDVFSGSIHVS